MARKRLRKALAVAFFGFAAVLLGLAAALAGTQAATSSAYDSLARAAASSPESEGIDWSGLLEQNGECVAWLEVAQTPISYPVVQAGANKAADYYLHHDFWGAYSSLGCPYLDARAQADGLHLLVYGHHLSAADEMFTCIYRTYQQDSFDTVGEARWWTPAGGDTAFTPVFALSVDKSYTAIQTFDFSSNAELRAWLYALAQDATAFSSDWDERCASATRVLTLVTCSSTLSGQRPRTLLLFVA